MVSLNKVYVVTSYPKGTASIDNRRASQLYKMIDKAKNLTYVIFTRQEPDI
jgi:hypothetical protein